MEGYYKFTDPLTKEIRLSGTYNVKLVISDTDTPLNTCYP